MSFYLDLRIIMNDVLSKRKHRKFVQETNFSMRNLGINGGHSIG